MKERQKRMAVATAAVILGAVTASGILLYRIGYTKGEETGAANKENIWQYLCTHSWNAETGKCSKCGLECTHNEINSKSECSICGHIHRHEYEGGKCKTCGTQCVHEKWESGICSECGVKCNHEKWANNTCLNCGTVCRHFRYSDGICEVCGYVCPHKDWQEGACPDCGTVCTHSDHDTGTGICNECGVKTYHSYIDGICSCGSPPQFVADLLPEKILGDCRSPGKVETVSYVTRKYNADETEIVKTMDIYLPYGYSTEEKYNVLILIHGGQGTYSEWTSNRITVGGMMSSPKNIYDNMIEKKLCRPLIIAGITTYYQTGEGEIDSGFSQMTPEIRNDILPYIISHYSTYAEGISEKEIAEEREHFGIGGVSNGALYAFRSGMEDNSDLFADYACFGGCSEPEEYLNGLKDTGIYSGITAMYIGTGEKDSQRGNCYNGFRTLTDGTELLTENENSFFLEISGGGHDWSSWSCGIYNALLVMFNCE